MWRLKTYLGETHQGLQQLAGTRRDFAGFNIKLKVDFLNGLLDLS